MEQAWYVDADGEPKGPYSRNTVVRMFANGTVGAEAVIWREGMSAWATIAEAGIAGSLPPALPTRASPPLRKPTQAIHAAAGATPPDLAVDDDGWQELGPAPWSRFLARALDTLVAGIVLWVIPAVVREATALSTAPQAFGIVQLLVLNFLTPMMVMPLQALTLGLTGVTAGKWLFGVRITRTDGRALGIIVALKRELAVFFHGMGLGIPLVAQLAQLRSYTTLVREGQAGWDTHQEWVVTHRPAGVAASICFVIGLLLLIGAVLLVGSR